MLNSNHQLIKPKFMGKFAIMYLIGSAMMSLLAPVVIAMGTFYEQVGYGVLLILLPLSWFHTFFNKDYATTRLLKLTNQLHYLVLVIGVGYLAAVLAFNYF